VTDKIRTKKQIERRIAGIKAMPPPKARPLPENHPARSIFRSINSTETNALIEPDEKGIPEGIPTTTLTSIPEGIPNPKFRESLRTSPAEVKSKQRREEVAQDSDVSQDIFTPLDATHTSSEKSIYSLMYRDTISKGTRDRHFGPAELMRKGGIRSRNTVHKALYGLIEKLSIEVLSNDQGNPLGPRYRIYKPKEIEQRRKAAGLQIDTQTKKILSDQGIPAGIPVGIPNTIPTGMVKSWDTSIPEIGMGGIPKFGIPYKEEKNLCELSAADPSSSSKSVSGKTDDEAFFTELSEFYERITGNVWTTADVVTAQRGQHIPMEVWGIAICYCVDRAPFHKFERLAYVLEEARSHYEEMKNMTPGELKTIMIHSARTIERARRSGKWQAVSAPEDTE